MGSRKRREAQASPALRYTVVAMGAVVLVLGLATTRTANAHHPAPRDGITSIAVSPSARYAAMPAVAAVYDMAAQIPEVLDGLYCHCDCSMHSGHRSLLTCFQDDHGAGCDVCLGEAELAFRMRGEGRALKEIRAAVDELYQR